MERVFAVGNCDRCWRGEKGKMKLERGGEGVEGGEMEESYW